MISPESFITWGNNRNNVMLDSSVNINVHTAIGDHCHLRPGAIVCGRATEKML